ncbi:2-hydroxychromene-2-carboxylate isomerase [Comamonas sp.]|uniref:2-hydroxychromene-2-carboxylate isomerase n=1 Tax=Comamonas sp. TaxID=34028 RepID=UPI00289BB567|nr:2-hydroxychromene-2-carboxylate isomerase [Comamonas sp.]
MTSSIDYFYWLNSDWALLGADRLVAIAKKHGVGINFKPVDLPHVYSQTGGVLLSHRSPERQAYRVQELKRWCIKLDYELNVSPKYMCPNADLASCIVIAAIAKGYGAHELSKAILRAEWCEERDISSKEVLREVVQEQGFDYDELLPIAGSSWVEQTYKANTEQAIAAGVFGSPSYVFEEELFWGQDRLDMLDEAIEKSIQVVVND